MIATFINTWHPTPKRKSLFLVETKRWNVKTSFEKEPGGHCKQTYPAIHNSSYTYPWLSVLEADFYELKGLLVCNCTTMFKSATLVK